MTNIEDSRNFFINLIRNIEDDEEERFIQFKKYIEDRKVKLEELNNKEFDILIFAIDCKVSNNLLKYIIEHCSFKTYNYTFKITESYKKLFLNYPHERTPYKVPLFSAIKKDYFEVADLLIKNNADINFMPEKNVTIVNYLYDNYSCIYSSQLKYLFKRGFYVKGFTSSLINKIVSSGWNNFLLSAIFDYFIFDDTYVLKLLSIYKNKLKLSNDEIDKLINDEKHKIRINETTYELAVKNKNFIAIITLLKYDGDGSREILNRIQKYDILKKAISEKELELVMVVLEKELLSLDRLILENLLMEGNRINNLNYCIGFLMIKQLLKLNRNTFNFQCQEFLLIASRLKNSLIMHILLGLILFEYKYLREPLDQFIDKNKDLWNHLEDFKKILININNNYQLRFESNNFERNNNRLTTTVIENCSTTFLSLILNSMIKLKYFDIVKLLIENSKLKINVNAKDENGDYPLITALTLTSNDVDDNDDNNDIFQFLLDHKADITIRNGKNIPILVLALQNQCYLIIKYILQNILSIKKIISETKHPFIHAIYEHDINKVKLLIKSKDNQLLLNNDEINRCTEISSESNRENYIEFNPFVFSFTPLVTAYLLNEHEIFEILLKKSDINVLDYYGYSLLHYAILKEDLEMVEQLINKKANVNFKSTSNGYGHSSFDIAIGVQNRDILLALFQSSFIDFSSQVKITPFISLIKSKSFSMEDKINIMEYFIKKGIDINAMDIYGKSALYYAIQSQELPLIKLMVKYGADVELVDEYKNSPLIYAIQAHSLPIVVYLIERGADANFIDIFDISLLSYAIQEKSLPMVKCLVEHGANANFVINSLDDCRLPKRTMFEYAMEHSDLPIVQYLLQCDINYDFNSERSIENLFDILYNHKCIGIFEYLMQHKIHIENITGDILKTIIIRKDMDYLKILVDHYHINVDKKDQYGYTPLTNAIQCRYKEMIEYLLDHGADIHYVNQEIEMVRSLIIHDELDLLKYLVEKGLDVNAKDSYGDSLLVYAITNRRINFVEYFLSVGAGIHNFRSRDDSFHRRNREFNFEFYLKEYKIIKTILDHHYSINNTT